MLDDLEEPAGVGAAALGHYRRALHELRCFVGDPVGSIEAVLAEEPDFAMAHAFKGWLFGLSTEKAAEPVTHACATALNRLAATPRERAHAAALTALSEGRWHVAGRILAEHTADLPLDGLAIQAGHQIDFFTGEATLMRERVSRALPAWSPELPGYHALLGMQAFGLEECGEYTSAEEAGRRAIDLQPRDGWAQHAVAHVLEMQSRQADGIAWMRRNEAAWTGDSFLQIHNWWHLALFHYERGEVDAILDLYDGPIAGAGSTYVLNLDDASAILWRLHLGGVDVGDRWEKLAALWQPKAKDGCYAFNDMHAMMAFAAAGHIEAQRDLIAAQVEAMGRDDDNARFTSEVGHAAALGIQAFAQGRHADAIKLLRPLPPIAHRFGGSHAQRDVIELTLIEAALRAGEGSLARSLSAKRLARRASSPLSHLFVQRATAV